MKYTATAPANIAFIKYWGKKDKSLRLPLNDSLSMNLSACLTTTTVEFSKQYNEDLVEMLNSNNNGHKTSLQRNFVSNNKRNEKVITHLNRIRKLAGIRLFAKVVTQNNFPSASGIASSASGFAALTLAGTKAAGLNLSEKDLTILARIGSGSACRSVPDGYVIWKMGNGNEDSYAHSLYPVSYWDLRDIVLIVSSAAKKVGSAQGMENVWSSPLMKKRMETVEERLEKVKLALKTKNFPLLGEAMEADCLSMHAVMQSQAPPLFYWSKETLEIIKAVYKARESGLSVFFTIDAGPNVHLFCESKFEKEVINLIGNLPQENLRGLPRTDVRGKVNKIVNSPAVGARISEKDLF